MNAHYFTVDDCGDAKVVEDTSAILPRISVTILAHRLIVKPIHSGDLASLVIASQQRNEFRILQLEAKQKLKSFD